MITKRIIPCLDVKNGRVVKGVNFEGLQDMADPVEMARWYNESGADELVFYDITASVEGRTIFTDILRRVASEIFIPLTVGGGIGTLEDFDRKFRRKFLKTAGMALFHPGFFCAKRRTAAQNLTQREKMAIICSIRQAPMVFFPYFT